MDSIEEIVKQLKDVTEDLAKKQEKLTQLSGMLLAFEQQVSPLPPKRSLRHWTDSQKQRILDEAERARRNWGGVKEVCERYKITSAHLTQWRSQLDASDRDLIEGYQEQAST